ncbi:hypothetical protein ACLOJK_038373 [Asimina triloba]
MGTLPEHRLRCSIFLNRPPSDPPPARLRTTDRSRPKNRPRRDDGSGRASTVRRHTPGSVPRHPHQEPTMAAHAVHHPKPEKKPIEAARRASAGKGSKIWTVTHRPATTSPKSHFFNPNQPPSSG